MARFAVALVLLGSIVMANAYNLGRSYGSSSYTQAAGLNTMGGSYGGNLGVSGLSAGTGSYGASFQVASQPLALAGRRLMAYDASSGPLLAAVQSRHSVQTYDVPSTFSQPAVLNIEVPSSAPTMNFLMKSRSSNLNIEAAHEGSGGSFSETSSVDEPHLNRHTVTRPVIQEVREIVTPFRKITQEVQPVQEEVETILPRGQYADGYGQSQGLGLSVAKQSLSGLTLKQGLVGTGLTSSLGSGSVGTGSLSTSGLSSGSLSSGSLSSGSLSGGNLGVGYPQGVQY